MKIGSRRPAQTVVWPHGNEPHSRHPAWNLPLCWNPIKHAAL